MLSIIYVSLAQPLTTYPGREFVLFMSNLSKTFSHKLTQVLTGHCKLNFFLNSIGKTLDPSCPCGKGIETVHHYLWVCQLEELNRTNTIRRACFSQGIPYPPKNNLLLQNQVLFKALCKFLSNSCRLNL